MTNLKLGNSYINSYNLNCHICENLPKFTTLAQFTIHLRTYHCNIHNGSYICQYGHANVCTTSNIASSENEYSEHVAYSHTKQSMYLNICHYKLFYN